MPDPEDLLRRAAALIQEADREPDPQVRERLLKMSVYYRDIAELENSLAKRPFQFEQD